MSDDIQTYKMTTALPTPPLNLYKALEAFRNEQAQIIRRSEGYRYKYAKYHHIREVIDPILSRVGLFIAHVPFCKDNQQYLRTDVIHAESGEILSGTFRINVPKKIITNKVVEKVVDKEGKIVTEKDILTEVEDDPQEFGKAITYYCRYGLCLLGLKIVEDNDAQRYLSHEEFEVIVKKLETALSTTDKLTDEQKKWLRSQPFTINQEIKVNQLLEKTGEYI